MKLRLGWVSNSSSVLEYWSSCVLFNLNIGYHWCCHLCIDPFEVICAWSVLLNPGLVWAFSSSPALYLPATKGWRIINLKCDAPLKPGKKLSWTGINKSMWMLLKTKPPFLDFTGLFFSVHTEKYCFDWSPVAPETLLSSISDHWSTS